MQHRDQSSPEEGHVETVLIPTLWEFLRSDLTEATVGSHMRRTVVVL